MGRTTKIVLVVVGILVFAMFYHFLLEKKTSASPKIIEEPGMATLEIKEEWKEYRPQSDQFVVVLPTTPQHAAQMIPVPEGEGFIRYDMYLAQSRKGATIMINVIEYPVTFDMSDLDALFNGVMREMLAGNPTNVLLKNSKGTFSGHPSFEFIIKNQEATMKTIVIQKDHRLYILSAADSMAEHAEESFQKLLESFKLQ